MLDRINRQDRSPIEYGDDLWSFFQNCWHLKDWVKNDPSVPLRVRESIEKLVAASATVDDLPRLSDRHKALEAEKTKSRSQAFPLEHRDHSW